MNWQFAVILTGVLSGIAQIVGKRQVSQMSAFQSGVLRDSATLIMVFVILVWQRAIPTSMPWQVWVIFFVGVLESVSIAAYFAAQRTEMAATAVFSYPFSQLLIVLGSGFAFSEWKYFSLSTLQGIVNILALILTFALMVVYQGGTAKLKGRWKWSNVLVVSAVVVAISNLQSKWAVSQLGYSPAQAMVYEYMGLLLGGVVYVGVRRQGIKVGFKNVAWGIIQGLLFGISALWYIKILSDHPLGISSMLRRVTIVLMTVSAGLWGWGERKRLSKTQIITLILGLLVFGLVMSVNR